MSNLIQVTADTLQQTHNVIVNNNQQISTILSHLQTQVQNMESSFRGNAADKYQHYYAQWHQSAQQLNDALNGIAQLTIDVLNAFQDQDNAIAGKINI